MGSSDREEKSPRPTQVIAPALAEDGRLAHRAGWGACMLLAAIYAMLFAAGCTSVRDYVRQGFKVGPEYSPAEACVAPHWIDEADSRVVKDSADLSQWWTVFKDPVLERLIADACQQNLSLREAGLRVLQARAQLGITTGRIFPQVQTASGAYQRLAVSGVSAGVISDSKYQELKARFPILSDDDIASLKEFLTPTPFAENWNFGFNLAWELDFWGRFRRAIMSAEETLEASVASYDQVQVTLLGDVATNYVQFRTLQKRIEVARMNIQLQSEVLKIAERRWQGGRTNKVDVAQARSNLAQVNSDVPQLRIDLRETGNRLCILLGIPPSDLEAQLGAAPIPAAPPTVVVGIPAELLRRRPDVRRAERQAAAQAEQIGIAETDLYPIFTINGTIGYQASQFSQLFNNNAFNGAIGPAFQWNILNYGRIRNNMVLQDAKFQELLVTFQNLVLQANAEAENGMVRFLEAQERAQFLDESVVNAQEAVDAVVKQYNGGGVEFNRVAVIELTLAQQQDLQAGAHGQIAQGLIQVYRALGGGWEAPALMEEGGAMTPLPAAPPAAEGLPAPRPIAPKEGEERPPLPAPTPQ